MAVSLQQTQGSGSGAPPLQQLAPTLNDDDHDTISLTSTVVDEEEDGAEYVVEHIHSEKRRPGQDGRVRPHFLVEWANFPLDQCTWEPIENLSEELMEQWQETKRTQDPSIACDFEKKQEAAVNKVMELARERHRRRNAKRRRLGFAPTTFYFRGQNIPDSEDDSDLVEGSIPDSEAETDTTESSSGESTKAEGKDTVDHKARETLVSTQKPVDKALSKPQSAPKQSATRPPDKVLTFNPALKEPSTKAKKVAQELSRPSVETASKNLPAVAPSGSKSSKTNAPGQRHPRDHELPSATGYQGSAKRPGAAKPPPTPPISQNPGSELASSRATSTAAYGTSKATSPVASVTSKMASEHPAPAMMARKSAAPPRRIIKPTSKSLSVNVFSEGKQRKKRGAPVTSEGEVVKKPRMYRNAQIRRKAELASRSKEDKAPDINKLAGSLFTPGADTNTKDTQSAQPEEAVKIAHSYEVPADHSASPIGKVQYPSERTESPEPYYTDAAPVIPRPATPPTVPLKSALTMYRRASMSVGASQADKKAKTVRWGASNYAPEPCESIKSRQARFPGADERYVHSYQASEINLENNSCAFTGEDSLFVDSPMEIDDLDLGLESAPLSLPTCPSTSLRVPPQLISSQKLSKKIVLPTSQGRIIDVSFSGVPNQVSGHQDPEWLVDFVGAEHIELCHTVFAETFISYLRSFQDQPSLFLACGDVASDDIDSLETIAEHLRSSASALFMSRQRFNLLVFPTACVDFQALETFGADVNNANDVSLKYFLFGSIQQPLHQLIRPPFTNGTNSRSQIGRERVVLFPKILGFQFSQLIRPWTKQQKKNFFLAFPERAICWLHQIGAWLSERDEACKIYTNFTEGSWAAFCEKAKKESCFVIIHEALVPFIRRFPSMAKLLQSSDRPILWTFSESINQNALPPATDFLPVLPTMFSRLFPLGKAILITPSFMVSRPRETYEAWKWLWKTARHSSNFKFVVPADIREYLRDLSEDKSKELQRLRATRWKNRNELEVASLKTAEGLSDYDLEARQKTWVFVSTWLSETPELNRPGTLHNNVVFVDRYIDPSDEQSLVNWFGWWAEAHCGEYRKFYVFGSDPSIRQSDQYSATPSSRASRTVKIPKYLRSVVNDPDEAMRNLAQKTGRTLPAGMSEDSGFRSIKFRSELQMNKFVADLDQGTHGGLMKLFRYVVSWTNFNMARHFGDRDSQLKTMEQWWRAKQQWLSDDLHAFRTYIGFFYTIADEYPSDKYPSSRLPPMRPWIVLYRPTEPHMPIKFRHGKTEIFIYDTQLGDELEDKDKIVITDLTWMQQQLVNYISNHASETDENAYVDRVWLGGFGLQQERFRQAQSQSSCPVDVAAETLQCFCSNLKSVVPGEARHLNSNGWRQVFNEPSHDPKQPGDHFEEEDDPERRLIFHPPQGSGSLMPKGASKCKNNLFEAARLARLRDKSAEDMTLTYPPTMDWYQHQVNEGRHFEHILVDSWHEIFKVLRIPLPGSDQVPTSATSARSNSPWATRNDSVGSNHSTPRS